MVLWLALALAGARPALADGDPPRIGIDPVRVAAGGSVTVHGVDFADAGPVSIVLVDEAGAVIRIGSATADGHGGFMVAVAIPIGTIPGAFQVRAVPADGEPVEGSITVGPANPEPGEQRGADEPLLAPMPGVSAPTVVAPAAPAASPAPAGPAAAATEPMGLGGLGLIAFLAVSVGGVAWARSRRAHRSATSRGDLP